MMSESSASQILGVLNLSPESMVRESIAVGAQAITDRASALTREGADWIDLGGRSITPDVPMVSDAEEQTRLGPALDLLKTPGSAHFQPFVSVDTWSAETARFALDRGADGVNYTGQALPDSLLEAIARRNAMLFMTFMPYENAYAMRSAKPMDVGLQAVLDHLAPKVEAARRAGVEQVVIDPNLGIIHPSTDDYDKIHQQLRIIWNLEALRVLGCPILLYAARKPERLARIMMASAALHAGADYIRTHTPEMIRRLDPQTPDRTSPQNATKGGS